MSTQGPSRLRILDRIRAATDHLPQGGAIYADQPQAYIRRGSLDAAARRALMTERLLEYGAEVAECAVA